MKKLMVLMMTGLLVGAWYTTFTSAVEKPMEYKKCLQQAQKNEEKEFITMQSWNIRKHWSMMEITEISI